MTAADDARACIERAGRAKTDGEKSFYLDQAKVHSELAKAEAIQHVADELAVLTIGTE